MEKFLFSLSAYRSKGAAKIVHKNTRNRLDFFRRFSRYMPGLLMFFFFMYINKVLVHSQIVLFYFVLIQKYLFILLPFEINVSNMKIPGNPFYQLHSVLYGINIDFIVDGFFHTKKIPMTIMFLS